MAELIYEETPMYFEKDTLRKVESLANDKTFGYLFDKMQTQDEPAPPELLHRLAQIFATEIGAATQDQLQKLEFALKMAAYAARSDND